MEHDISRRDLMKIALLAGALAPALGLVDTPAHAADLTPLDANDPTAKALGFVPDVSKVDTKASPSFKAGQKCAACAQFQGKPTDPKAACTIFGGRSVPASGWCSAFTQRPA